MQPVFDLRQTNPSDLDHAGESQDVDPQRAGAQQGLSTRRHSCTGCENIVDEKKAAPRKPWSRSLGRRNRPTKVFLPGRAAETTLSSRSPRSPKSRGGDLDTRNGAQALRKNSRLIVAPPEQATWMHRYRHHDVGIGN